MMTVAAVQVEGGLAVLAIVIAWFTGISLRDMFVFETFPLLIAVVCTFPMLVLCRFIYMLPFKMVEFTRRFLQSIHRDFIRHCTVTQLLLVAIMSGIGEELLFRGILQTAITNAFGGGTWGLAFGIGLTSLLFGLAHPINKLYVFLCFVIGIYLGLFFAWTDNNLVVPIIIHALYNFVIFLAMPQMLGFSPDEGMMNSSRERQ
jgi:membrane protease YdiL (CAAX protease family)